MPSSACRVKEKMTGYTSRTDSEAEGRQIKYALGRPVTRVILDEDDNVILNVGEIITHKAIERARAAGALDMLLESVYDREPDIRNEEMRASEPGDASLDVSEGRRRVG